MYIELIDSYIFEVTKHLSRKEKSRVSEILEEEIYVKIDEYMEDKDYREPTSDDVKEILWHFGRPEDVAINYTRDNYRPYIAPPYSRLMKGDFRLSWILVALAIIISALISVLAGGQEVLIEKLLTSIGSLILSFIFIYFIYVFAFSHISRSRQKKNKKAYIDSLVAKPNKSNTIGKFGISLQIIVSSILVGIFGFSKDLLDLTYPNIVILEEYTIGLFPLIILVYFMSVLSITYKDIDRRYSFGELITTILANLGTIGLTALIFLVQNLDDTIFHRGLAKILPANGISNMIIENLGLVIFFIVVAFGVLNIVYSIVSYHTDKKQFGSAYDSEAYEEYGEDEYYEESIKEDQKAEDPQEAKDLEKEKIEESSLEPQEESKEDLGQTMVFSQGSEDQKFEEGQTALYSKDDLETALADSQADSQIEETTVIKKEDGEILRTKYIEEKQVQNNDQDQEETRLSYKKSEIEEANMKNENAPSIADSIRKSNPENK